MLSCLCGEWVFSSASRFGLYNKCMQLRNLLHPPSACNCVLQFLKQIPLPSAHKILVSIDFGAYVQLDRQCVPSQSMCTPGYHLRIIF